jgi:hypothetical protein
LTQIHYLTEKYSLFESYFNLFYYLTLFSNSIIEYSLVDKNSTTNDEEKHNDRNHKIDDYYEEMMASTATKKEDKKVAAADKDQPKTLNEFFTYFLTQQKYQQDNYNSRSTTPNPSNNSRKQYSSGIQKYLLKLANRSVHTMKEEEGTSSADGLSLSSTANRLQAMQVENEILENQIFIVDLFHEILDYYCSQFENSWKFYKNDFASVLFPFSQAFMNTTTNKMKNQLYFQDFFQRFIQEKNGVFTYLVKSLNIFYELSALSPENKTSEDILSHFKVLVKYFLLFRYQSIQEIISLSKERHQEQTQRPQQQQQKKDNKSPFTANGLLELQSKLSYLASANHLTEGKLSNLNIFELENVLTELLGIPLPLFTMNLNLNHWMVPDILMDFSLNQVYPFASSGNRRKEDKNDSSSSPACSSPFFYMQAVVEYFLQQVSPLLYEMDYSMGNPVKMNYNQQKKRNALDPWSTSDNSNSRQELESSKMKHSLKDLGETDKEKLANSKQLKDIQQELYHKMFGETNRSTLSYIDDNDDRDSHPFRSKLTTQEHLISEANKTMNKQRKDQLTQFLELLNQKAVKKKNILKTLMDLWNATKIILEENYSFQTQTLDKTKKREEDERFQMEKDEEHFHYRKPPFGQSQRSSSPTPQEKTSILKKKLFASSLGHSQMKNYIPVEDIYKQTRQIQDILLKDIQSTELIKEQQLENRIEIIRKGFEEKTILFENKEVMSSFQSLFLQIDSMKNGLLQANNDAMRISAKIIQQLKEVSKL